LRARAWRARLRAWLVLAI